MMVFFYTKIEGFVAILDTSYIGQVRFKMYLEMNSKSYKMTKHSIISSTRPVFVRRNCLIIFCFIITHYKTFNY